MNKNNLIYIYINILNSIKFHVSNQIIDCAKGDTDKLF